jgi:hypothetical protein
MTDLAVTAPHDLAAERAVLGAALLEPDQAMPLLRGTSLRLKTSICERISSSTKLFSMHSTRARPPMPRRSSSPWATC